MNKVLSKCIMALAILSMLPFTAFAGGSSVSINETNVRDKFLTSGTNDQLLMSFTVQPTSQAGGDLTLKSMQITCMPAHGLTNVKLMQNSTEIDSSTFGLNPGWQSVTFKPNSFKIPYSEITEFQILVDVRENTGDFISACAIDNIEFYSPASDTIYTASSQNDNLDGINRLVYVDDPNDENRIQDTQSFTATSTSQNLGLDTTNNLLIDFTLFSSNDPETYLNDVFIYCSNASIIKNANLQIGSKVYPVDRMNSEATLLKRPENTQNKRFVFTNLNEVLNANDHIDLKLYGDTYNYFSYPEDRVTSCSLIDTFTTKEPVFVFSDLKPDHPDYTAITELYWDGLLHGYEDGTFKPDQNMTRAEFITLVFRSLHINTDGQAVLNCFSDVNGDWYGRAVCFAKNEGLIDGYPDGSFKPGNNINNAEALKILLKSRELEVGDAGTGEWYSPYVNKASELGLFDEAASDFSAGEIATRGAISEYIYKLDNYFTIK